ncbi:MAG TPA: chlorite dismutase family protein [Thermomicrobiales bacterium]|nr:chlorite dismutase family protein [Thermomicrobiales bacterium]
MTPENQFAAWWLYRRGSTWPTVRNGSYGEAAAELAHVIEHPGEGVTVRGTYTALGLGARADMVVWAHAPKLDQLQQLAIAVDRASLGAHLDLVECYIGVGGMSQYDPTHGPAFVKGIAAKRYLSVYPFSKTPDWFLLDYKERRRLMIEHGEMGREFPDILTNTVNSFGIQDQEFVVALEDDDPEQLIKMVQRLRGAEVRKWTANDTPIYLGERKPIGDVLNDIRGR